MKSTGVVQILLLLSVLIVCVYAKVDGKVSLMPNYPFVQRFENWKLEGSAYSLGDRIRLTGAEPNRAGIAKNVEMIDSKLYFEAGIEFSVHSSEVDGGEGFVLWITKDPVELGLNFGGPAIWEGFAIIFETNQHAQQNDHGLQFPRVSVHQNNGRKVFDWDEDGSNTFLQGCHFPFKKINMDARNFAYLLIEGDTLHLFVSVKDQWQKCVIDQKITQIGEFYMTLTASTTSRSDFHDIFKLGVRLTDEFEHEQEAFARPPLSMLAPLITHKREELADRIMDVDDDDVIYEINDFKNWIVSQLDSLKLSVGGSVVEINFGLDQLNQQSLQLYRELEKIRQSNANITSEFEKAAVQSEKILYSDKAPTYEPISALHSDLKKVEATAISISNSVTAIQQDQNRKRSMKNREKIQLEATLKNLASWGTIITVAIAAIVVVVYAFKQFKKPKHTSAPSWAA